MYEELKNIIQKINQRYHEPTIIIGGDFNDKTPPKELQNIKLRPLSTFTRLNSD